MGLAGAAKLYDFCTIRPMALELTRYNLKVPENVFSLASMKRIQKVLFKAFAESSLCLFLYYKRFGKAAIVRPWAPPQDDRRSLSESHRRLDIFFGIKKTRHRWDCEW